MGREEQQGSDEITRKGTAIIREEIKGERKKLRQSYFFKMRRRKYKTFF